MVGETLSDIRVRIEDLAATDGDYCVVCARTGARPVPVAGRQFPDRGAAEAAAEVAAAYRATLRRWDPRAPCYDFIACEVPAVGVGAAISGKDAVADCGDATLTGFCHDVAAAVLETLSAHGHGDVESSVMEAYCASATAIEDPDDLCLHLLRTLAFELDARLSPAEQRDLLRGASDGLTDGDDGPPVAAALDRLAAVDLVDQYTTTPAVDPSAGSQSWTVTVEGYALPARGDALPTLPVAVALLERLPDAGVSLGEAVPVADGVWQFRLTLTDDGASAGLLRAPVVEPA